jgi:integrase
VELLKAHRARCAARALASGASLGEAAYLFAKEPDGSRPMRPDAMTRRFRELAEALGQGYTLHGLRHFMATQLGAVAEAATVRARMGHGSLAVSSLYTHRVSAADRAAAEHMGKVLDG